ncbi:MAG: ABC transporter permease [Gemmatimonadota bacterium]
MNRRDQRLYRVLLHLFPSAFRDRWAEDMEAVFRHRLEEATTRRARARVWITAVADTTGQAALEWWQHIGWIKGGDGMNGIGSEWKQAVRGLQRTPWITLTAVLTMALGIGANTAMFSVVDGVVLEPLPYDEPDGIVAVWPEANFNTAMVREIDEAAPALSDIAGISIWTAVLSEAGDPTEVDVARVTPSYFRILGVDAALGRTLTDDDGRPGAPSVVVLTHDLWVARFGADPDVLGRSIALSVEDATAHTVVGVMPNGYDPIPIGEAWTAVVDLGATVADDNTWFVNRRIGRIAPGATIEQADAQVASAAQRIGSQAPNQFDEADLRVAGVVRLKESMTEDARLALWGLLGAVGLVLLIACANVANLLLARGESRRTTLAVRAALGASRRSIARLLLIEASMIGVVGGLLGLWTAYGSLGLILSLAPPELPRIDQVSVDGGALAFAVTATLLATLLAGLWPAIRASRVDPGSDLTGATRAAAGRRSSRVISHGLVGLEMALAVVVALGSALMLRSLGELLTVDLGFEPEGVVVFRPNALGTGRSGVDAYRSLYGQVWANLQDEPGVESVGGVQVLTGSLNNWSFPTWPEGHVVAEGDGAPTVNFRAVLPGYFETLEIPLLSGRTIEETDRDDTEGVVVVNQTFVDTFWPDEDPIGRTLNIFSRNEPALRVVGVVGDIRQHGRARAPRPELYVPFMDWDWEMSAWMVVRTRTPDALESRLRAIVDEVDASAPIAGVQRLDEFFDQSASSTRFFAVLLSIFGFLGLALGAIGIYGVSSFAVARRAPEFGVRVALGATRFEVVRTAMLSGAAPIVLGAGVGLAASVVGTRWLRSYLFEVQPTDPLAIVLVLSALGGVAVAALAIPAWRAGRVDPARVLGGD